MRSHRARGRSSSSDRTRLGRAWPLSAVSPVSVALDELDPNAVNPLDEREPHRYTAWKRERPRLGRHLDVLRLERRDGVVDVQWTESDVVDRVAGARCGFALRREQPDATVVDPVKAILHFADGTAEFIDVPRQRRIRIRSTQVNVVQSELRAGLHDFQTSTD